MSFAASAAMALSADEMLRAEDIENGDERSAWRTKKPKLRRRSCRSESREATRGGDPGDDPGVTTDDGSPRYLPCRSCGGEAAGARVEGARRGSERGEEVTYATLLPGS